MDFEGYGDISRHHDCTCRCLNGHPLFRPSVLPAAAQFRISRSLMFLQVAIKVLDQSRDTRTNVMCVLDTTVIPVSLTGDLSSWFAFGLKVSAVAA